ncbi:hypothetical protein BS17DRAFT_774843 [Gyrodon lividus]|nr:hypothetical protein BS17DRAFT_774843 [Gyrodon lividus]
MVRPGGTHLWSSRIVGMGLWICMPHNLAAASTTSSASVALSKDLGDPVGKSQRFRWQVGPGRWIKGSVRVAMKFHSKVHTLIRL